MTAICYKGLKWPGKTKVGWCIIMETSFRSHLYLVVSGTLILFVLKK